MGPSIESGIEDGERDDIYEAVMRYFLTRLEERGRRNDNR